MHMCTWILFNNNLFFSGNTSKRRRRDARGGRRIGKLELLSENFASQDCHEEQKSKERERKEGTAKRLVYRALLNVVIP